MRPPELSFSRPDPARFDPEAAAAIEILCRRCGGVGAPAARAPPRCPLCGAPGLLAHPELGRLGVAHIDCDAFYASVEKRDRPELRDKPLIIGGGARGVVATACYIARLSGVRSAMPMFKARKLCPDAVVLKPEMAKYVAVSREIQTRMRALTPLVEPLSLDEAFLDLRGAERAHRAAAAETLAAFARRIEAEIGVSVSIGLAPNKFLAKIASELDKPRGFAVIGAAEAQDFLADKPVSLIWGVGARLSDRLAGDGFRTIGDLRAAPPERLTARYGAIGRRLADLSRGEDARPIKADSARKSVSAETTFTEDLSEPAALDAQLWRLSEEVSARLKSARLAGGVVTLKLKTAAFKTLTRRVTLDAPTDLADRLYRAAAPMLAKETAARTPYRLLGLGAAGLAPAAEAASTPSDLFDSKKDARAGAERAVDAIRERFGHASIGKGRGVFPKKTSS